MDNVRTTEARERRGNRQYGRPRVQRQRSLPRRKRGTHVRRNGEACLITCRLRELGAHRGRIHNLLQASLLFNECLTMAHTLWTTTSPPPASGFSSPRPSAKAGRGAAAGDSGPPSRTSLAWSTLLAHQPWFSTHKYPRSKQNTQPPHPHHLAPCPCPPSARHVTLAAPRSLRPDKSHARHWAQHAASLASRLFAIIGRRGATRCAPTVVLKLHACW